MNIGTLKHLTLNIENIYMKNEHDFNQKIHQHANHKMLLKKEKWQCKSPIRPNISDLIDWHFTLVYAYHMYSVFGIRVPNIIL